jgi:hypothetical protein
MLKKTPSEAQYFLTLFYLIKRENMVLSSRRQKTRQGNRKASWKLMP